MPHPAHDQERRYSEVAEEFGGALERLARAYEGDADRRRDLLQEIHVALWRSLGRFDGRCSMRTWVYRVAHNVATSRVIRARERTLLFVDAVTLESIPDTSDREAVLDRERTLDRVYALIRQLRPIDRQIMLLYLEDVDAPTISEVTGMTARNVATKIHRIKQLLARRFHDRGADHE
jgi:RNA polymerase sigma-70 factor (ECF subfamily)